jgi:23S rRNA pseudouridine2605 synthase
MAEGPPRLQKFLAEAGVGSRRHCEDLIRAGRVTVDGVAAQLGSSVDPDTQQVALDGIRLGAETKEYWLLNKPRGVVSTASDPQGRPTVVESVPSRGRVYPVGRLDLNTTGVLILTNDGELTAGLLHPSHQVEKEYLVTVRGTVSQEAVFLLRRGVELEDGLTAPAGVDILETRPPRPVPAGGAPRTPTTTLSVVLHEGRKRQVRRMMESVGHVVVALHRRRFDSLTDAGLPLGQARLLSAAEVEQLKRAADRGWRAAGE